MTLRDIIMKYRRDHGMSQRQFAAACGLSNGYISMIEKNANPKTGKPPVLSLPALRKLAESMDMSMEALMAMADDVQGGSFPADAINSPARQARRINVLGSVPAGVPMEAIEDIIDWEELPESMFGGGREYFGLRVRGDSMWPDILDGDVVIVQKTPVCDSGAIAVVYINGYDATLKQVRFNPDGSMTLQPRNPTYPPRTYTPQEIRDLPITIAGKVVELRRKLL